MKIAEFKYHIHATLSNLESVECLKVPKIS